MTYGVFLGEDGTHWWPANMGLTTTTTVDLSTSKLYAGSYYVRVIGADGVNVGETTVRFTVRDTGSGTAGCVPTPAATFTPSALLMPLVTAGGLGMMRAGAGEGDRACFADACVWRAMFVRLVRS